MLQGLETQTRGIIRFIEPDVENRVRLQGGVHYSRADPVKAWDMRPGYIRLARLPIHAFGHAILQVGKNSGKVSSTSSSMK